MVVVDDSSMRITVVVGVINDVNVIIITVTITNAFTYEISNITPIISLLDSTFDQSVDKDRTMGSAGCFDKDWQRGGHD